MTDQRAEREIKILVGRNAWLTSAHPDQLRRRTVIAQPSAEVLALKYQRRTNDLVRKLQRAVEHSERAQWLQAEEYTRQKAEQVAREESALELAAKSHAEARRQRIMTAWSIAVAVAALIVAVVAIAVAG